MKTNVMKKAWEIAKEAVVKFGGKVKEYFAEALRIAWATVNNEVGAIEIELAGGSRKHKSWVAEITGTDAKYGLKREFINGVNKEGEGEALFFELQEGKVYDVKNATGSRKYVKIENGQVVELPEYEVKEMFANA